jgi:protein SCO1/2
MKAFNASVSDKMQHQPLTFLKAPGDARWVRIHGLVGTSDLLAEYRQIAKH